MPHQPHRRNPSLKRLMRVYNNRKLQQHHRWNRHLKSRSSSEDDDKMQVDRQSSGDSSDFVNSRPAGKVRDGCNIRIRCNLNRCGKFFTSKHVLVWHKRAVHTGRKCTVVQFVGKYSQDMTTYRDINVTYMKMTNMFVVSAAKEISREDNLRRHAQVNKKTKETRQALMRSN